MFLESIQVLNVDFCVQEKDKYVAQTRASSDLTDVLPYLNSFVRRADYNPESCSLKFVENSVEFTIVRNEINIQKFVNRTELHELLDWVQDLVNDTYESREEITPCHTVRTRPAALTIYTLLPKTNCKLCGEKSCMAFAARLNKMEVDIEDCPPLLDQQYDTKRHKLEAAFV